ncbi:MAG TPA: hypothetical protein VJ521_08955 [Acidobacteriota bacterium]|nr:hypothetical protein [Acidobacteriota bacterium]
MLGLINADHEESSPNASLLLINKLSCSLVGQEQAVRFRPGSQSHRIYGKDSAVEVFACNYGLNEAFRNDIANGDLQITGSDEDGTARIVELPGHRFFIATLFVPQMLSVPGSPHPLITAFLREAYAFSRARAGSAFLQLP